MGARAHTHTHVSFKTAVTKLCAAVCHVWYQPAAPLTVRDKYVQIKTVFLEIQCFDLLGQYFAQEVVVFFECMLVLRTGCCKWWRIPHFSPAGKGICLWWLKPRLRWLRKRNSQINNCFLWSWQWHFLPRNRSLVWYVHHRKFLAFNPKDQAEEPNACQIPHGHDTCPLPRFSVD